MDLVVGLSHTSVQWNRKRRPPSPVPDTPVYTHVYNDDRPGDLHSAVPLLGENGGNLVHCMGTI